MHGVARTVLHTREVAVEFFCSDGFTNHVKQLSVILRGTHSSMPPGVDVSNVEDRDGSFNMVHDFKDFFETAPEFLSTGCFNSNL